MNKLKHLILNISVTVISIMLLTVNVLAYTSIADGTPLGITAEGAILIDADTDTILYKKSIDAQCRPASLTKMMTLLVAYENTLERQNELITVTKEMIDVPAGSSSADLSVGDKITVHDLFYAMMLPSGNDAAKTLAYAVSGSEKAFTELMNRKAQELGMNNTHFMNAHGFDEEGHYTTTYDLALLAHELCRHPELVQVFSSYKYTVKIIGSTENGEVKSVDYYNSNTMINPNSSQHFEGLKGIKTGYTDLAGNCLASYLERDGRHLICVVTHSDPNCRDTDTKALMNYGMNKFDTFDAAYVFGGKKIVVDVENAEQSDESNGQLELYLDDDGNGKFITVSKEEGEKLRTFQEGVVSVRYPNVTAPINAGDCVGNVEFVYNNEVIYTARALASRSVEANATSPADFVKLDIKGKIRISFDFVKSKYFLIPFFSVLALAVLILLFVHFKKRQTQRMRSRQKNVTRRKRNNTSSRPGNRTML